MVCSAMFRLLHERAENLSAIGLRIVEGVERADERGGEPKKRQGGAGAVARRGFFAWIWEGRGVHAPISRLSTLSSSYDFVFHSGRQHAQFGAKPLNFAAVGDALVPFCASMMPTVGPRSKASLRAAFVREIMAVRSTWTGRASDLLRARIAAGEDVPDRTAGWPRNPRALAGRLRRCQTFLRTVGIDIAFSREGRTGSRMIRMTSLTKSPRASVGNGRRLE